MYYAINIGCQCLQPCVFGAGDNSLSVCVISQCHNTVLNPTYSHTCPGKNIYQPYGENGFHISSGTSFAAPIVSGIVGLVLESHGKAAAKTMKQRLINSSRKLQSLSGKVSSNGLINAYNAMTGQTSLNLLWQ